ncbi:MAG TPA: hypothetical protein VGH74_19830 [Planctomycetaceae bacterium]|jgi:hypothetical protein
MATADLSRTSDTDAVRLRDAWLSRLTGLVGAVQQWAEEFGWSTRRIEKRMQDSQIGEYHAPALLLQMETDQVLLDPIARMGSGVEGIVDLYLMPAYDDIASLTYCDGDWRIQYTLSGASTGEHALSVEPRTLSKDTLQQVLATMRKHAGSTV